ncbi:hypothetical protein Zmor_008423 [Zophobas morio]|uniref:Adenosine deaminase n=2 Tax=Zophobas morio TaxID=2755281 RepID=A0AA38MQT2_9CUCU|nr:hypothetical protein Zmor_008423 [Zophobas morio]
MYKSVIAIVTLILIILSVVLAMLLNKSEDYCKKRDRLLAEEDSAFLGANLTLTSTELKVDKILLELKTTELSLGYKNSSEFLPALPFHRAKERIDESKVFGFIRKLPKGGSLHTHLLAAASVDFLVKNISYRDGLYGGEVNGVFKLKFMHDPLKDNRTKWTSVKDLRLQQGSQRFDQWLLEQLTLTQDFPSIETAWTKFKRIFTTTYDLYSYKPVFQEYIQRVLQELYDDNVMYTELKGTIMILYDLDGTTYSKQDFFRIFQAAVEEFKSSHPKFVGVRYIHSIYRGVDFDTLQQGLDEIIAMKKLFPDFVAGFDFVGFEEEGKTLLDYAPQLLQAQKYLRFFFHAGESSWFGHTDLNLADALLLNSFRIGHGFAITKHPKLLDFGKEHDIPLEICPISNQVLKLNEDPRNHPAATLMALNYPIVIGNDDPSIWNATGLSYDWYVVFMAMTPKNKGLEVLKQLAINSIRYSAMDKEEKNDAMKRWQQQWNNFLIDILLQDDKRGL